MMLRRLAAVLSLSAVLVGAFEAFARAGGGNSYSGSSSSSSSSSDSSSSSSSRGSYSSSGSRSSGSSSYGRSSGKTPGGDAIGAVCTLLMVGAFVFAIRAAAKHARQGRYGGVIAQAQRAHQPRPSQQQTADWIDQLRAADPRFDLAAFKGRCKDLFFVIQDAWFFRKLDPARAFLSDATFRRFAVQLQLMELQGLRNAIADYAFNSCTLVGASVNDGFDAIQVRIEAAMRDTNVSASLSDEVARALAQAVPRQSFSEIWTFVRRRGVQTAPERLLCAGRCPNCGAGYGGGESNQCAYCDAVVNSGQHDWVLAEITQDVEFSLRDRIPGIAAVRGVDAAFNVDVLEDRASLLFFKWIEAQAFGEPRRLAKVAKKEFIHQTEGQVLALASKGLRRQIADCAIGSVGTLCFSEAQGGRIAAHVEVRWSARIADGREGDPVSVSLSPATPRRHVLVLERAAEAKTKAERGLSTNRCPGCNAALTDDATPTCDYCSAELGDGAHDWVLAELLPFERWMANRPRALTEVRPASFAAEGLQSAAQAGGDPRHLVEAEPVGEPAFDVRDRERVLMLIAAVAASDGEPSVQEKKVLREFAQIWKVGWVNLELAMKRQGSVDTGNVVPASVEAEVVLRWMVQMAKSDGKVDKRERELIALVANRLQVADKLEPMLRA